MLNEVVKGMYRAPKPGAVSSNLTSPTKP